MSLATASLSTSSTRASESSSSSAGAAVVAAFTSTFGTEPVWSRSLDTILEGLPVKVVFLLQRQAEGVRWFTLVTQLLPSDRSLSASYETTTPSLSCGSDATPAADAALYSASIDAAFVSESIALSRFVVSPGEHSRKLFEGLRHGLGGKNADIAPYIEEMSGDRPLRLVVTHAREPGVRGGKEQRAIARYFLKLEAAHVPPALVEFIMLQQEGLASAAAMKSGFGTYNSSGVNPSPQRKRVRAEDGGDGGGESWAASGGDATEPASEGRPPRAHVSAPVVSAASVLGTGTRRSGAIKFGQKKT